MPVIRDVIITKTSQYTVHGTVFIMTFKKEKKKMTDDLLFVYASAFLLWWNKSS